MRGSARTWVAVAVGVAAFLVLAFRFSPNWFAHAAERRAILAQAAAESERAAINAAFDSTISLARGTQVERQVADLSTTITDPNHAIVRWRLLFPVIGRATGLPKDIVLGLSHLGCVLLAVYLVLIGCGSSANSSGSLVGSFWMAVVLAATAPFFTSMAWLGYFDAWLALALLVVGFARQRWLVLIAALCGPWIDERFVLGLPLACVVRYAVIPPRASGGFSTWIRAEILAPAAAVALFLLVRLSLGGTGGSQTIGAYVRDFIQNRPFDPARLLRGAWEGLRLAWLPVLIFAFLRVRTPATQPRERIFDGALLAIGLATLTIALFTALDLSRSMVLLLPLAVYAWRCASRSALWRRLHLAPLLGSAALVLPASHVVSEFILPVDAFWRSPMSVAEAANQIGNALRTGNGVAKSDEAALRWFRRSAAAGFPLGMSNLGAMHAAGQGVPKEPLVAVDWFQRSADLHNFEGQTRLAMAYFQGEGVAKDDRLARLWFERAAVQGHAAAQANLATMYLGGLGGPKDPAKAHRWYLRAAAKGHAGSAAALGDMYSSGNGVPVDVSRALAWLETAARLGHADAMGNIGVILINGSGVPADRVAALAWFALAAKAGSPVFAGYRDRLRNEVTAAERSAAEVLATSLAAQLARPDSGPRIFQPAADKAR